jgi:cytochrome b6-f complex iron-sulfur subunit
VSENQESNQLSRRQFFGLVWVVAAIGLMAQIGKGLWDFLTPVLEEGAFGTVVRAGRVNEFDVGSVSYFRQSRFYLVRLQEGFLAMYRKCPHLGCVVPWNEEEGNFNCPCHTSLFTTEGEVISGPAPRPMDIFPIEMRGDEIFVDTGQVIERDEFDPSQVKPV